MLVEALGAKLLGGTLKLFSRCRLLKELNVQVLEAAIGALPCCCHPESSVST